VKCLPPPSIKDGTYEPMEDFYEYNDVVTYSCDSGVNLIGASELTCSNDGTFQPAPPRSIICDSPLIPYSVIDESPPYTYNSVIKIKCNKGYKLEGSESLTCGNNGWIPALPRC
ncbi:complement receptor-like protein isoform X5, partial [Silurus asotus]